MLLPSKRYTAPKRGSSIQLPFLQNFSSTRLSNSLSQPPHVITTAWGCEFHKDECWMGEEIAMLVPHATAQSRRSPAGWKSWQLSSFPVPFVSPYQKQAEVFTRTTSPKIKPKRSHRGKVQRFQKPSSVLQGEKQKEPFCSHLFYGRGSPPRRRRRLGFPGNRANLSWCHCSTSESLWKTPELKTQLNAHAQLLIRWLAFCFYAYPLTVSLPFRWANPAIFFS